MIEYYDAQTHLNDLMNEQVRVSDENGMLQQEIQKMKGSRIYQKKVSS